MPGETPRTGRISGRSEGRRKSLTAKTLLSTICVLTGIRSPMRCAGCVAVDPISTPVSSLASCRRSSERPTPESFCARNKYVYLIEPAAHH
jgi:hypothetical protein